MSDFNPYAAPQTSVASAPIPSLGGGVWQDGPTLVMTKVAELPNRCVKCNAPATFLLKRSLSWHPQALYLIAILLSPLLYIIVALIVRKTATTFVPLCDEHRAKRSNGILIAWLLALGGLALCFAPAFDENLAIVVPIGMVTFIFGLIFGIIKSQPVKPKKIDDTHVWLSKVCPAYLSTLPPLPGFENPYPNPKPILLDDEV